MEAIVFTGPTISADDAGRELPALYLPPAAQGDVYRAVQLHPKAIGIIDGYFERVPSVWHKEILWAMNQGIHVFGSASMGALRAAELTAFGMEGVGTIFEAYRDGRLEDDDEVTVLHGPAEAEYLPQSDAMVNIRSTLRKAVCEDVIPPAVSQTLESIAKSLFYPQRSYPQVLAIAAHEGIAEDALSRLAAWLPARGINLKRDDAIAMLRVMRCRLEQGLTPKRVSFSFEHTVYWDHAVRRMIGTAHHAHDPEDRLDLDPLLEELRLTDSYRDARDGATARYLAIEEARRRGMHVDPAHLQDVAQQFRRELELLAPADAERWQAENQLAEDGITPFLEEEALLRWVRSELSSQIYLNLPGHLRSTGEFASLHARAMDKAGVLAERGLQRPALEDVGLTEEALFRWYFERFLGRQIPRDITVYAQRAGFRSREALKRAALREFCYSMDRTMGDASRS